MGGSNDAVITDRSSYKGGGATRAFGEMAAMLNVAWFSFFFF